MRPRVGKRYFGPGHRDAGVPLIKRGLKMERSHGLVEVFGHFGGTATGLLRLAGDQLGQSGPGCTRLQGQDMVETGFLQGARGPHGAAGHLKPHSTVYNELYTDKLLPFLCLLSALVTKQIKTLSKLHCYRLVYSY